MLRITTDGEQVNENFEVEDGALMRYLFKVKVKINKLEYFRIVQIPWEENQVVDLFSKTIV